MICRGSFRASNQSRQSLQTAQKTTAQRLSHLATALQMGYVRDQRRATNDHVQAPLCCFR